MAHLHRTKLPPETAERMLNRRTQPGHRAVQTPLLGRGIAALPAPERRKPPWADFVLAAHHRRQYW